MRLVSLLSFSFFAFSCGVQHTSQLASTNQGTTMPSHILGTSYEQRLRMIEELGAFVPGYRPVVDLPQHTRLGLWAGIWLQTEWQQNSGRAASLLWRLPNAALTVEPWRWLQEMRTDRQFTCEKSLLVQEIAESKPSSTIVADLTRLCLGWQNFFLLQKNVNASHTAVQAAFWHVHTAALRFVMKTYATELAEAETLTTKTEADYWRGWTLFVFDLEKQNFPTTGRLILPIVKTFNPNCFPLDAPHCRVDDLPLLARRNFTRAMIKSGSEGPPL